MVFFDLGKSFPNDRLSPASILSPRCNSVLLFEFLLHFLFLLQMKELVMLSLGKLLVPLGKFNLSNFFSFTKLPGLLLIDSLFLFAHFLVLQTNLSQLIFNLFEVLAARNEICLKYFVIDWFIVTFTFSKLLFDLSDNVNHLIK